MTTQSTFMLIAFITASLAAIGLIASIIRSWYVEYQTRKQPTKDKTGAYHKSHPNYDPNATTQKIRR